MKYIQKPQIHILGSHLISVPHIPKQPLPHISSLLSSGQHDTADKNKSRPAELHHRANCCPEASRPALPQPSACLSLRPDE